MGKQVELKFGGYVDYKVSHSNGHVECFPTYDQATDSVFTLYACPVVGHAGDLSDGGDHTLCWISMGKATDDDRACCKITREIHEGDV
jgi:hypothetical protein